MFFRCSMSVPEGTDKSEATETFGYVLPEVSTWNAGKEHNNDHAARQHRTTHRRKEFPDELVGYPATRDEEIPRAGEDASQVVAVVRTPAPIELPGSLVPLPGPRGPC